MSSGYPSLHPTNALQDSAFNTGSAVLEHGRVTIHNADRAEKATLIQQVLEATIVDMNDVSFGSLRIHRFIVFSNLMLYLIYAISRAKRRCDSVNGIRFCE
jgi:hypothetical protein